MANSTYETVQIIFRNHFFEPAKDQILLDQLSSLELVHLVTELEKSFSISISALEINEISFASLESVSEFILSKKPH